jgi:hypothetical protein
MLNTISANEASVKYGRHPGFFRTAVGLGMLRALKLNPVLMDADELEAWWGTVDAGVLRAINDKWKGKTRALPGNRPGRKPGTGKLTAGKKTGMESQQPQNQTTRATLERGPKE